MPSPNHSNLPLPFWQDMAQPDFEEADRDKWIAILPIGAVEQHGPHLPLATDRIIGEELLGLALKKINGTLPVTALPFQAIGKSNEHSSFKGTLSLEWQTIIQLLLDIGASVKRAGVKKLVIINSHGGNASLMDIAGLELRQKLGLQVVATSWMRFGFPDGLFDGQEIETGIHGGDIETSLMLYFRKDLVRMKRAENFSSAQTSSFKDYEILRHHGRVATSWLMEDLNDKGVVGNALNASAEKGEKLADYQAQAFCTLLNDFHKFGEDVK